VGERWSAAKTTDARLVENEEGSFLFSVSAHGVQPRSKLGDQQGWEHGVP